MDGRNLQALALSAACIGGLVLLNRGRRKRRDIWVDPFLQDKEDSHYNIVVTGRVFLRFINAYY